MSFINSFKDFVEILDSAGVSFVVADYRQQDMPLVFVTDGFCKLTGYDREEALGHNCRFLQGPETSQQSINAIREAIHNKNTIRVKLINYKKSGEKFFNDLTLVPVFDQDECIYYAAIQIDITDKDLENPIRSYYLEKHVLDELNSLRK